MHALLFPGELWAWVRGHRHMLARGPIMPAIGRMVTAVRTLIDAWDGDRAANVRLNAGDFTIGVRFSDDVTLTLRHQDESMTLPALGVAQAALPIWRRFMEAALVGEPVEDFPIPDGLSIVSVDRLTGLKANLSADCSPVISEVFIKGTEPTEYCSIHRHRQLELPYPFQPYALSERGELIIPEQALSRLLDSELDVYLVDGGQRLEGHTADGIVSMMLAIEPGGRLEPLPDWLLERFDPSDWIGLDGREAQIVWLR